MGAIVILIIGLIYGTVAGLLIPKIAQKWIDWKDAGKFHVTDKVKKASWHKKYHEKVPMYKCRSSYCRMAML